MTADFESASLGSIPSKTLTNGNYVVKLIYIAPLAQSVERTAVNRKVTGSKPVWSEQIYFLYLFLMYKKWMK